MCQYHVIKFWYIDHSILKSKQKHGPGRKQSKNKHGGHHVENQGLLKKLPRNWHVVFPTNMRNQNVGELYRWQGHPGRSQSRRDFNRPKKRITTLFLSLLGLHYHNIPEAARFGIRHFSITMVSGSGCFRRQRDISDGGESEECWGIVFWICSTFCDSAWCACVFFWSWNWSGQTWRKSNWL